MFFFEFYFSETSFGVSEIYTISCAISRIWEVSLWEHAISLLTGIALDWQHITGLSLGLPGWEWTPEDPASLAALQPWQEQGAPLPRCGEILLENTTIRL